MVPPGAGQFRLGHFHSSGTGQRRAAGTQCDHAGGFCAPASDEVAAITSGAFHFHLLPNVKRSTKDEPIAPLASEVTPAAMNEPVHMEGSIAVEAYLLWEAAGCPEGCAEEFWFAAARKLGEPDQLQ